jgi:hypothetical protein
MELYRRHRDLNALAYFIIILILIPLADYVAVIDKDWKTEVDFFTLISATEKVITLIYLIIVCIRATLYYTTGFIKNFGDNKSRLDFFFVRIISGLIDLLETSSLWLIINIIMCKVISGKVSATANANTWKGLLVILLLNFSMEILINFISILFKNVLTSVTFSAILVLGIVDMVIKWIGKIITGALNMKLDYSTWLISNIKNCAFTSKSLNSHGIIVAICVCAISVFAGLIYSKNSDV